MEQEIVLLMPPEHANVHFVAFFNWTLFICFSPLNTELPCIRKQMMTTKNHYRLQNSPSDRVLAHSG